MTKRVFKTDMHCQGCATRLEAFLQDIEGIAWTIDLTSPDKLLVVEGEVEVEQILEALDDAGLEGELLEEPS